MRGGDEGIPEERRGRDSKRLRKSLKAIPQGLKAPGARGGLMARLKVVPSHYPRKVIVTQTLKPL